jgi:hypothetical protein
LNLFPSTVEGNSSNNLATDFAALVAETLSDATFTLRWKGWMLQQALASPNNRDLNPVAGTGFSWPPTNGVAANNFWVKYYPNTSQLGLTFLKSASPFTMAQLSTTSMSTTATSNRVTCASISSGTGTPNCTYASGGTATLAYQLRYFKTTDGTTRTGSVSINSNSTVQCSSAQFGVSDLDVTRARDCRVAIVNNQPSGMTIKSVSPSDASDTLEWQFCASENGTCSFTGTTVVRYGAVGGATYRYKQVTGSVTCNNATFDDPALGNAKSCAIPVKNITREVLVGISAADLFPNDNNNALTEIQSTGVWDGNLIIDAGTLTSTGTAVQVDGTVSVNGDVVIRGQMMGRGRIVARGNIYIIGDLVYGCGTSLETSYACKTTETDTSKASYRNSENLPKTALLAGGTVIIGDYDFPDYRATSTGDLADRGGGVYDLVNDQVGRDTGLSSDGVTNMPGGATNAWPYYSVPGSTGANSKNSSGSGDMGFVPMQAAGANGKNCSTVSDASTCGKAKTNRYFSSAPFAQIINRPTGFGSYEVSGSQLNSIVDSETTPTDGASVVPLYPSNGPLLIGASNGTNGFSQAPGSEIASGMTCSIGTGATSTVSSVTARRFGGGTINYNFGFYCPPNSSSNRYLRSWGYGTTDPGQDSGAWMRQSPQNAGLDGNRGMSTGWLAGLIRPSAGTFQQLGDLSQTRLLKLMWLSTMEGSRAIMPLRTDGIFYSAHAIFGLSRSFANTWSSGNTSTDRSKTEGRWIHNGSVVAAELGFLVTGDYTSATGGVSQRYTVTRNTAFDFSASETTTNTGPAMSIYYDTRLAGMLQITSGAEVQIQRTRGYAQVKR